MDDFKEFQGKSLDEAIRAACSYFDAQREKLEIDPANPRYIETLRGTGYRWLAPEAHEA